jgi:hypothetical protein
MCEGGSIDEKKLEIGRAVYRFANSMEAKMLSKYDQGYRGWDDPSQVGLISERLLLNLEQGDFVDVANLAMMLHRFNSGEQNGTPRW